MKAATKVAVTLLAAMAMLACLGVAPALADTAVVLCKVNAEACKKENAAGEAFTATAEASFKLGELGTVKCSSTMSRDEAGKLSTWAFTACSEGCEVTTPNLPYTTSLNSFDQTITMFGGGGDVMFNVLCGGNECAYGSKTATVMEFKGGSPASITVSKALERETESFFCPKAPTWEAVYKLTSPESAVYMLSRAREGPVFCKANEKVCLQKMIAPWVQSEPTTPFKITKLVGGVLSCSSGWLEMNPLSFEPGIFIFEQGFSSCTHPTYTSCTVSFEGNNNAYLFPSAGGNGEIAVKGKVGKNPTLRVKCSSSGTPFECKYSTEEFGVEFVGGTSPLLEELGSMTRTEGSATFCPSSIVIQGTYEAVEPSYMTEA